MRFASRSVSFVRRAVFLNIRDANLGDLDTSWVIAKRVYEWVKEVEDGQQTL